MNLNNDQEVIDEEEEDEEEEEGEQKQSANHSSRILVEVPVEVSVSAINIRIIFVVVPLLMVTYMSSRTSWYTIQVAIAISLASFMVGALSTGVLWFIHSRALRAKSVRLVTMMMRVYSWDFSLTSIV